jgi:acyl carrier protein
MTTASFDAVRDVLTGTFKVDPSLVQTDTPLNALGLDSLSLMEFVFAIEDHFGLRIPEDRLDPRQADLKLQDLCSAVDDALALQSPSAAHGA